MTKPITIVTLFFLILGLLVTLPSCNKDKSDSTTSHSEAENKEASKGRHGGRLLSEGDIQLEVTIFERGVPPEYRVYAYKNENPIDPSSVNLNIQLHRLGGRIDNFQFKKEQDYLRGSSVVEEPHSFDVKVMAKYEGKNYHWEYPSYEGRTTLTPEGVKNAGIVIETAGPAKLKKALQIPGEVILNPDKQTHILPRFDGIITKVYASLGDHVQQGQPLATIESMELADEKKEYIETMHEEEFAQKAYEREEMLWNKKITSEQEYLAKKHEYEEAKIRFQTAGQKLKSIGISVDSTGSDNLASYTLRSSIRGVVIEKNVAAGQAVQAEKELFVVADLSTLYVEVTVHAQNLNVIREGQAVRVSSDVLNSEIQGRLAYIGSLLGKETRSAKGRILIDNPDHLWRPGLFVKVDVVEEEVMVPLAVKVSALQTFRDWDVVFLAVGNTFEIRPLELGRKDETWVEVLSGIENGDKYVSENSFVIKADVEKSGATHDH